MLTTCVTGHKGITNCALLNMILKDIKHTNDLNNGREGCLKVKGMFKLHH